MQLSSISLAISRLGGNAFGAGASLALDFTSGNQTLDPRITFTRSSTATFTGSNGLIQSAAINAPRFDYNPTTLAPLGLLIEESRTNLLVLSIPDAAIPTGWTVGVGTGTFTHTLVPATASLSGFQNFIRHSQTTLGRSYLTTPVTLNVSTTYTLTVRFNPDTLSVTSGNQTVIFIQGLTGATGTLSLSASSVPSNGVARITFTTATAVIASVRIGIGSSSDATGVAEFGAWQLEAGAFPTSYIPTVASQVTRAADVAVMTGANFSSWYNQAEGTFVAEWMLGGDTSAVVVYQADDGTNNNAIRLRYGLSGTANDSAVIVSATSVAQLGDTTQQTLYTSYKNAMAYKVNDFARSADGATVITDTFGSLPTASQLTIGKSATVEQLNGHIRRIAYYPRRLSNSELRAITA